MTFRCHTHLRRRLRGPPLAWSSLMGLLRPHRAVATDRSAPTAARGHQARPPRRILPTFWNNRKNCQNINSTLGGAWCKALVGGFTHTSLEHTTSGKRRTHDACRARVCRVACCSRALSPPRFVLVCDACARSRVPPQLLSASL